MTIEAKIVCDSINGKGKRLTTFELKYPRFLLPEINTHRLFSRSTASNRAVPTNRILDMVKNDTAMPIYWGVNQPGMTAKEEITPQEKDRAIMMWLALRDAAVDTAKNLLLKTNLHKQTCNRVLEPFMHSFTILTATDFENFYNLRRDVDAQPEIKALADAMFTAQQESTPTLLKAGEWHLPYVTAEERATLDLVTQKKCSVARCARVSYLNHDGSSPDISKDCLLHDRLLNDFHMSPFEHQATPRGLVNDTVEWYRKVFKGARPASNFHKSWIQYRKSVLGEHVGVAPTK